ncbi:hypothetical protein PUNSTDRAFT_53663 [Punctularia strigosozonata HHB-11173 SS5]|uniref:uncharacterized protein n=1 Tax=Punctularia strigosozonata (strain HHB-11173) TaxID=741275 RepID=UPI000441783C|nr:uncharacterized protein PUNSTDRAFT_53663 [Punctularia strigosozonata HHB-11173 SS5]EIN07315.1 hypothetical protein PUNSTDRAFT_53663 [Punctularia strigosozonata HHB-11173 SS5]
MWALSFVIFPKRRHDWTPTTKEDLVIEEEDESYTPRYHVFTPKSYDRNELGLDPRRMGGYEALPLECLEEWIGKGVWGGACSSVRLAEPRIDFVWTWVNGSDPAHRAARVRHVPWLDKKRFRENDELRYSLRSVLKNTENWKEAQRHLISNSYAEGLPSGLEVPPGQRMGQIPQWLRTNESTPDLLLHHDADIFRPSLRAAASQAAFEQWQASVLPTFNSMAVESQLANLSPSEVSDNTVFLMDDIFLLHPLTPSSFHTPLYGPVLRLHPELLIRPGIGREPGEMTSMRVAGLALSARFGIRDPSRPNAKDLGREVRGRPYIAHDVRSVPLPLLHEAKLAFPEVWQLTAHARTRGADPHRPESHTLWLAIHFVVERHREAMLWSWVIAKWGGGGDSVLTAAQKAEMWAELGGGSGTSSHASHTVDVPIPVRRSRADVGDNLRQSGLPPLLRTNYSWVSADGYPYHYLRLLKKDPRIRTVGGFVDLVGDHPTKWPACTLDRKQSLGEGDEPAVAVFERLLLTPGGDCVISALMGRSGTSGVSAFLPPPLPLSSEGAPESDGERTREAERVALPLALSEFRTFALPADPRAFVLRLLQRYSYAVSDTPTEFLKVLNAAYARNNLRALDEGEKGDPVFLCINDDIMPSDREHLAEAREALTDWWETRWPEKMDLEL